MMFEETTVSSTHTNVHIDYLFSECEALYFVIPHITLIRVTELIENEMGRIQVYGMRWKREKNTQHLGQKA